MEKKFQLTGEQEQSLLAGAVFVNEKTFADVYYDTPAYFTTKQDWWLRQRESRWELKVGIKTGKETVVGRYDELETESEIRAKLGLKQQKTFAEDLAAAGYKPYCHCITTRKKYKKEGFTIDLDTVAYNNDLFTFTIAEIEAMVESETGIDEAVREIIVFAKKQGLEVVPLRGKVVEFLKQQKPEHYKALVAAGVLREH